jgi:hypothetical protein
VPNSAWRTPEPGVDGGASRSRIRLTAAMS